MKQTAIAAALVRASAKVSMCPVHQDQVKPCRVCDRIFALAERQARQNRKAETATLGAGRSRK